MKNILKNLTTDKITFVTKYFAAFVRCKHKCLWIKIFKKIFRDSRANNNKINELQEKINEIKVKDITVTETYIKSTISIFGSNVRAIEIMEDRPEASEIKKLKAVKKKLGKNIYRRWSKEIKHIYNWYHWKCHLDKSKKNKINQII